MAEILTSLTIIGIIAAVTLPALQANINESAWRAQRKALFSRMSQAISMMPSLNGYGTYAGSWSDDNVTVTDDTAAQAFVTEGLNTVLKINNICTIPKGTSGDVARNLLKKCGIPDNLTNMKNSKMPFPTNLTELNPMFTSTYIDGGGVPNNNPQKHINTNAAAFETNNGESVAVFYNPYCQADMGETGWHYIHSKMCANFLYDLNGRKGPNKVGKDIGFITAIYPVEPEIVAPVPLTKKSSANIRQDEGAAACRALDEHSRLPNIEELMAMFYNGPLIDFTISYHWSGSLSTIDSSKAWVLAAHNGNRNAVSRSSDSLKYRVRCVKR